MLGSKSSDKEHKVYGQDPEHFASSQVPDEALAEGVITQAMLQEINDTDSQVSREQEIDLEKALDLGKKMSELREWAENKDE